MTNEMNLFELTKEWLELQKLILESEEDGTDTLDLNVAFSEINEARLQKLENIIKLHKNFSVLAEGAKEQKKKIDAYYKRMESKIERLEEWLAYNLTPCEAYRFPTGEIYWRSSKQIEATTDNAPIPECYQRVTIEPNKTLMTQDIKSGATIPGWALVEKTKLKIR